MSPLFVFYLLLSSAFEEEINKWWSHTSQRMMHTMQRLPAYDADVRGFEAVTFCVIHHMINSPLLTSNNACLCVHCPKIHKVVCFDTAFCNTLLYNSSKQTQRIQLPCTNICLRVLGFLLFFGRCPILSTWFSMSNITSAHWWFQECPSKLEPVAESPCSGE